MSIFNYGITDTKSAYNIILSGDKSDISVDGTVPQSITGLRDGIAARNPAAAQLHDAISSTHNPITDQSTVGYNEALDTKAPSHQHVLARFGVTVSAAEKRIPYHSTKHIKEPRNLNGEVEKDGDVVWCRHLSAKFVDSLREKSELILPHKLLGSPEAIQQNVSSKDDLYENLKRTACGKHIIENDRFGDHLTNQAKRMEPGQNKQFLLITGNHAMAFELRCHLKTSGDGQESAYVVRFYDPNLTDVVSRCEVNNPNDFSSFTSMYVLRNFMKDSTYKWYFENNSDYPVERECIIYDCSNPAKPNPKFITLNTASDHGVSAAMLYHLMTDGGDPDAIRAIAQSTGFKALSPEARKEVLLARNSKGNPGLFMALQRGHAEAVKAYGALLGELTDDERALYLKDLLAAKRSDGTPGLFMALQDGHAEAIKAYGALLGELKLTPAERAQWLKDLLAAKDSNGVPGLFTALKDGHAEAIKAYGALLDELKLPPAERALYFKDLLEAKDSNGVPGLYMALQNGHAEAIKAYGALLGKLKLPLAERALWLKDLLAAKRIDGIPGLFMALQFGHARTITAYGALLDNLTPQQCKKLLCADLMDARGARRSGVILALNNGHTEAVEAYGALLGKLPSKDRGTLYRYLLRARNRLGPPQLHFDTHAAYNTMLQSLLPAPWTLSWAYYKMRSFFMIG